MAESNADNRRRIEFFTALDARELDPETMPREGVDDTVLAALASLSESEYTEGGDLKTWARHRGGLDRVPLEDRLELMAQAAQALQAAHGAGCFTKTSSPATFSFIRPTRPKHPMWYWRTSASVF